MTAPTPGPFDTTAEASGVENFPPVSPTDDTCAGAPPASTLPETTIEASDGQPLGRGQRALAQGATIGRYVVLEMLGSGGMGVVVTAYDPKLDRKVAIKLIRTPERQHAELWQRMEREAQAMARLSDPNVVTIYEVGEHEGQIFLAMEFVKGRDLRVWLDGQIPGNWRIVLDIFLQAGQGLAAAHKVGIVHRDFKPGNVFVGDDGRVRVGDFGLAREGAEVTGQGRAQIDSLALARSVTRTGATLGTPAYMAPEQFAGEAIDARTDQFAFCVALWEALYGQRPFVGDTIAELMMNVTEGRRSPPPARTSVPAWLRRVLERGLSPNQELRYPTTDALLAALRADPTRRRSALAGVAAAALVIAGGVGTWYYFESRQVAACEAEGASIAEIWNDRVQEQLQRGLLATGVPYAATTAERVVPYFSTQADAWRTGRTKACLNARVKAIWDDDMLERSLWCLDERRVELAALITELSQPSPATIQNAVTTVAGLPRVGLCLDVGRLGRLPPPPPNPEGARAVQTMLLQADAMATAGSYNKALAVAEEAKEQAKALDWPSLIAAAQLRHGSVLESLGRYGEAEDEFKEGYFNAAESGAWEVAGAAALRLVSRVAREEDGLLWARNANIAATLVGVDAQSLLQAAAVEALGTAYRLMKHYTDAGAFYERALISRSQMEQGGSRQSSPRHG